MDVPQIVSVEDEVDLGNVRTRRGRREDLTSQSLATSTSRMLPM
jgi:hypothetical protein